MRYDRIIWVILPLLCYITHDNPMKNHYSMVYNPMKIPRKSLKISHETSSESLQNPLCTPLSGLLRHRAAGVREVPPRAEGAARARPPHPIIKNYVKNGMC